MAENHQILENSRSIIKNEADVAVVAVSFPFQGHMNQFLHLSRIISSQGIPVHFVGIPIHSRQAKLRAQGWDPRTVSNLHFHDISIPSFEAPPPDPDDPSMFPSHLMGINSALVDLNEPIENLLQELAKTSRRVVLIIDFILSWLTPDMSFIPNSETYIFHVFPAFSVYYIACAFAGKPILFHGEPMKDLPPIERVLGPKILWQYIKTRFQGCKVINHGNLYNTCRAIEDEFLNLLAEDKANNTDKHWALGPFSPISNIPAQGKTSNKYLEWLDKQRPKSVIYVAFGTTTTFSDEQLTEIALGLEKSGHNFLWVLKYADKADFSEYSRRPQLPEGFEERVDGRGIIVQDWVPQLEILAHPSTGCFLSHCGWNSTLEAISMGVTIAAWPMHSEQPQNAILISQVLKIGMPVRECTIQENEIVASEAIEEILKTLMCSPEGDEMRQRAAELSNAVKKSVKEDGAAVAEVASFIAHISR